MVVILSAGARFMEVGLQEVKPALELLAIGFTLPLLLLVLEILLRRVAMLRKKHEKRVRIDVKAFTTEEHRPWQNRKSISQGKLGQYYL